MAPRAGRHGGQGAGVRSALLAVLAGLVLVALATAGLLLLREDRAPGPGRTFTNAAVPPVPSPQRAGDAPAQADVSADAEEPAAEDPARPDRLGGSVADTPPPSPEQLQHQLEALVASRERLASGRVYAERFEQLRRSAVAGGAEAAATLEAILISPDASPRLRRASVRLLGAVAAARSLPLLADLMRADPDEHVRRLAARALASYRPSARARQALVQELRSGEPFSGTYAVVFSLSEFGNRQDVGLFQDLALQHRDPSVRMQALHALGRVGGASQVPFMLSVARNDPHPDPRSVAEQLLRDLGS